MSERTVTSIEEEIQSLKRQIEILILEKERLQLEELKSEYGEILDILKGIPSKDRPLVVEAIEAIKQRTRKINEFQQQVLDQVETEEKPKTDPEGETPVKRKRGRPRKNPIIVNIADAGEKPRRKRGRPKKNPEEQKEATSITEKDEEKKDINDSTSTTLSASSESVLENMTARQKKRLELKEKEMNGGLEMSDILDKHE